MKNWIALAAILIFIIYMIITALIANNECEQQGGVYARPLLSFYMVCIK